MRAFAFALLLLCGGCAPLITAAPSPPPAPAPASGLDSLFTAETLPHAHWGVLVRGLRTGEGLVSLNADRAFTPASTLKLLTGAVALETLGPDYRFRTVFAAEGPIVRGTLEGNLVVHGSGDPTFSDRFFDDPRAVMRAWADSLRARGIERVAGGIIGVDSAFAGPGLGTGWAWDDLPAGYAAEVGALQFNEGIIQVQTVPGSQVGMPAVVVLDPPTQHVRVANSVVTVPAGVPPAIRLSREEVGAGIRIEGEIPADTPFVVRSVAVRGAAEYFLAVLRETLREAGIAVEGQALTAGDWPVERSGTDEFVLFTHHSPPLAEILGATLKPSQNWIAETLLRAIGREMRGEGSASAGTDAVDSFLTLWGIDTGGLRIVDGSGLSRYSLLTPGVLVELLTRMTASQHWETWLASLPIAGRSGTLAESFLEPPLAGHLHAKTGSLWGIRGLAGYYLPEDGDPLVFAFLVNSHLTDTGTVDAIVEKALIEAASYQLPAAR